jgi:hypothetical protein
VTLCLYATSTTRSGAFEPTSSTTAFILRSTTCRRKIESIQMFFADRFDETMQGGGALTKPEERFPTDLEMF